MISEENLDEFLELCDVQLLPYQRALFLAYLKNENLGDRREHLFSVDVEVGERPMKEHMLQAHRKDCPQVLDEEDHEECHCPLVRVLDLERNTKDIPKSDR